MITAADSAFFLAGLPILIYGYVICLDSYSAFGKDRHLPKWVEPFFMILFGVIVLFGGFAKMAECHPNDNMCRNLGVSMLMFSLFMFCLGMVGLMKDSMPLFATTSASWTIPLVFVISAVFMWLQGDVQKPDFGIAGNSTSSGEMHMHKRDGHGHGHDELSFGDYDAFMARGFAIAAFTVAALRAMTMVDPVRWGVFTAYATTICGLSLIARCEAILGAVFARHLMPSTLLLAICAFATLMIVPLLAYIYCVTRNHLPQVYAAHRPKHECTE